MRGSKAKRIRRKVYGDFSLKEERYYIKSKSGHVALGRRREYQDAKKGAARA